MKKISAYERKKNWIDHKYGYYLVEDKQKMKDKY